MHDIGSQWSYPQMKEIRRLKSLTEFHRSRGLPPPQHPLISVIDYSLVQHSQQFNNINWVFDFYSIGIKKNVHARLKYGQQDYDFDEGLMFFISPGQTISIEVPPEGMPGKSGWILLLHPDLLWNTPLANTIRKYEFFHYAVNEALFLSDKEEAIMNTIIDNIRNEYLSNIDKFSQTIIISQIETLLSYSERFYERQFITRKITNHKILERLEQILTTYFDDSNLPVNHLPTVQYIADQLNVSPSYLSSLLKVLTGASTQQHIQNKIIEVAKTKLSTTQLTVSEIAYQLGFEHSQSFSKMFKAGTTVSPLQFRASFN